MRTRIAMAAIAAALLSVLVAALSGAAVRTSHSGWYWGNPLPQGHPLQAVEFAGARGYAVGDFGTIVRTDDGGATWAGIRTGTTANLSSLQTIDANTFVAAGGCTLLRSDNAGDSFSELRFTPSRACASPLAAFSFAGKDVGYLLRADGSVLRTTDGGQRFASRASLPSGGGAATPPNDLWASGPDTAVAVTGADVTGRVYRTNDGGATWNQVGSAHALKSLFFVSSMVGYAVGDHSVLKTTDGGATWADQPDPGAILNLVRCADEQHCVVVAGDGNVEYTDDGFATLQPATRPAGGTTRVGAIAASYSSATRAVAVGGTGSTSTSDDAGKTFAEVSSTLTGTYHHLRATSPSVAYAPGAAGSVARTTDGGRSWTAVGVPTTNAIVDVAFPGADLGYAIDDQGSLFRTDDGGASWQILGQPGSGSTAALWASPGGGTVLLVGSRGMLRSTDGGQHFAAVAGKLVSKSGFDDVDRTAAGAVIAYGAKVILVSKDGGQHWRSIKRPSRRGILQLDFIDSKIGYALTSDSRVWRTAKGGRKWSELPGTGTSRAYSLSFGDARNGWLAVRDFAGTGGGQGWVLHTSDGGKSWRPQLIDSESLNVHGIAGTSNSTAFALTGRFFGTDTGGDAGVASTLSLKAVPSRVGRHGGKTFVSGKLSPAAAGQTVAVLGRDGKTGKWRRVLLTTAANGTFGSKWKVKRTMQFVAQWAGSQAAGSAGSGVVQVGVRRR